MTENQSDRMEIPMFMTYKVEKFDGDPPRFRTWNEVPWYWKVIAFFSREQLVKEPVEVIEKTYDLHEVPA
jgi:hypothetical protein